MKLNEEIVNDENVQIDDLGLTEKAKEVNNELGAVMTIMQNAKRRPTVIAVIDPDTRQVHVVTGELENIPYEEREFLKEMLEHATERHV